MSTSHDRSVHDNHDGDVGLETHPSTTNPSATNPSHQSATNLRVPNPHLVPSPPASQQRVTDRTATASGVVALVLAVVALGSAPLLLLIPYLGFIPALIAGAGAAVAARTLHRGGQRTGLAVAGLVVGVVSFALLGGVATLWTVLVADPAVRDYQELHEVIDHIKSLVWGR